jgi:hypothetical protein
LRRPIVGTKMLKVEISDTLYDRFNTLVREKGGRWRGKNEAAYKASQTAVEVALEKFLNSLPKDSRSN